jgi:starvation-inducible DNA-binding protein
MKKTFDQSLAALQADYHVLYQKLRGYHWTVSGPLFFGLHAHFEALYEDVAEKIDAIAERLAARGARPPVTIKEQLALARLTEDVGPTAPHDMVRGIASDLETLDGALRPLAREAEEAGDRASANLLDGFADGQEKARWMLRSFLAQ